MDARLQDGSIEEQRGVVRFLRAGGVKPVEIHRRMLAQNGQSTVSQRKVYEWVERFKSCRTRVTDEGRSGRLSTSRTEDHIDTTDAMIREDRRITVSEVSAHLDCVEKYAKLLTVISITAVKCILPLLFDSPSYILTA
jgi:hypothetical protein